MRTGSSRRPRPTRRRPRSTSPARPASSGSRGAKRNGRSISLRPFPLPLLGSNQDSPDPESGVLPVTPRGRNLVRDEAIAPQALNLAVFSAGFNPFHAFRERAEQALGAANEPVPIAAPGRFPQEGSSLGA